MKHDIHNLKEALREFKRWCRVYDTALAGIVALLAFTLAGAGIIWLLQ